MSARSRAHPWFGPRRDEAWCVDQADMTIIGTPNHGLDVSPLACALVRGHDSRHVAIVRVRALEEDGGCDVVEGTTLEWGAGQPWHPEHVIQAVPDRFDPGVLWDNIERLIERIKEQARHGVEAPEYPEVAFRTEGTSEYR
jgi:hypothetical protein